ncbi:hypothetical protein [Aquipuribacter sp. MA13-13]|uniref:hypothetical protein n=1 Tax=Aquipuribacter sp. MA13-13 TaxID=3440840 RepID=UPI003EED7C46
MAPTWALPGLSGAGTMLAGALLLLLRQPRRRQSRLRRPGRTPTLPDSQHVVVEKSVRAHTHTATTIGRLDEILRRLATACLHRDEALPTMVAVTLDRTGVTLHLATPNPAPAPWTSGQRLMTWHLPAEVDLDHVGPFVADQPAPFPLLVTVGVTPTGATTMLNLEHLGIATVTGDRQRGEDLLRYIAAEIGCNPWSDTVRAHCVGVATELGPLNPERIHVTAGPEHADPRSDGLGAGSEGTADAVADLTVAAVAVVDRSTHLDLDVPDARIRQAGDNTWPPHLLLLDGSHPPAELDTLIDLIRAHPARTGTTVLLLAPIATANAGDSAGDIDGDAAGDDDGVQCAAPSTGGSVGATDPTLRINPDATLTVTGPAETVIAAVTASGLSAAEAQGCAALYALGPVDTPMPAAHADSHGWQAYADAAGALTRALTLPRHHHPSIPHREPQTDVDLRDDKGWPVNLVCDQDRVNFDLDDQGNDQGNNARGNEGGANERGPAGMVCGEPDAGAPRQEAPRAQDAASLLAQPDEEYLDIAATTREDLETLAPLVPEEVRNAVAEIDPGLDEDLAAWFADSSPLPRLTLLGPVGARTRGVPVTKRKPYYTELLTFLATRPHGATPEEVADAFDVTTTKARGYVATVRDWLGTNPRTGRPHIPDARHSPAAQHRGVGVYEVQDLLVDADLFRRLRLRGQTRGPDGIQDLKRALTLVSGPPFSKLRPGGWSWLVEGDRLDQHMLCAVVDVAHLVTTHLLHTGDLPAARATAELAALAAPDEEIPRLDLAAVAMASGHRSTAADIIERDVCNRADDAGPPDELSARTHAILERHGWLTDDRQAAS